MKYEFTIFGSGISAKITSCLLAKNGFNVCLISDKDKNKEPFDTNLVTFLSSGSLNYLSSMIPNLHFFNEYPPIETIKCQLNSLSKIASQSIKFNDEENDLGKIVKNSEIRLIREGIVIYTGSLSSLKRFKDDVKEVGKGYDCGLQIKDYNDIKVGDEIEGFVNVAIKKKI